jgi:hypothetical protein
MSFVKALVITILVSIGMGFVLSELQKDVEYETVVEVKDKDTEKYIGFSEMKTFPNLKTKYNDDLAGEGRIIFKTKKYTLAYISIEAEGFSSVRLIQLLDATKVNVVYLEKNQLHSDEAVGGREEFKGEKTKNNEKVDLLPTFKEK